MHFFSILSRQLSLLILVPVLALVTSLYSGKVSTIAVPFHDLLGWLDWNTVKSCY